MLQSAALNTTSRLQIALAASAGFIFLLAFFVWGSLNLLRCSTAGKQARGLWGTVVAVSATVTAAQIGGQLAFAIGGGTWAEGDTAKELLALAGFREATDVLQLLLVSHCSQQPNQCRELSPVQ